MSNIIIEAAMYARHAHEGQKRKYSGIDYIIHPGRVANLVMLYGEKINDGMIAAAWLHDVIEDCRKSDGTQYTYDDITDSFGWYVADIVAALTNPSKYYQKLSRAERKAMDREHLRLCGHKVKLIKLADRLDNFRDVPDDEDFKKLYADESYALLDVIKDGNQYLAGCLVGEIQKYWAKMRVKEKGWSGIAVEDLELK